MHRTFALSATFEPSDLEADTRALGEQLRHCEQGVGRWFELHCAVESMRRFTGRRLMSVVFLSTVMIGLLSVYG